MVVLLAEADRYPPEYVFNTEVCRLRLITYDFTDPLDKPSPLELLKAYSDNQATRSFVDQVVRYCPKPAFIPARNWHFRHVRRDIFQNQKRELHPEAFVLVHAVQLLLFAPQDWHPDRVYSRDFAVGCRRLYRHRGPHAHVGLSLTDAVLAGGNIDRHPDSTCPRSFCGHPPENAAA